MSDGSSGSAPLAPFCLEAGHLPQWDILGLAQRELLVRAERETPPGGIPLFVTRTGWNLLVAHYNQGEDLSASAERILPVIERLFAYLCQEIAARDHQANQGQAHEDGSVSRLCLESCYYVQTDLFPGESETLLLFLRDKTHHIICAVLGTSAQISLLS